VCLPVCALNAETYRLVSPGEKEWEGLPKVSIFGLSTMDSPDSEQSLFDAIDGDAAMTLWFDERLPLGVDSPGEEGQMNFRYRMPTGARTFLQSQSILDTRSTGLYGDTFRQVVQYDGDGYSRAEYAGLAMTDERVNRDSVLPSHCITSGR